jgi:cold shock CspA family protein
MMFKVSKKVAVSEQQEYLKIGQQMFKKEPKGDKVLREMLGQLVFWNTQKKFGFIRTPDMQASDESFFCHGSDFLTQCGSRDVVKFDVWENFETKSQKAVNVSFHQSAMQTMATDEIGVLKRWWCNAKRGVVQGSDGQEYACELKNFEEEPSKWDTVCFDVAEDFMTSRLAAVHIRRPVKHAHLEGVEGRIAHLGGWFGFISTKHCEKDVYFSGREWTRVTMQNIQLHHQVIFDVIMEEDGSFTAEHIVARLDSQPAACDLNLIDKVVSPADDLAKKTAAAVHDDSASTAAATDIVESQVECLFAVNPEQRKLEKKLREIAVLEGRRDLDSLQQKKVKMKQTYVAFLQQISLR